MSSIKLLNQLVQYFFKHQIVMKMYHFQTKKYGAHKASDSYLDTFLGKFDSFMEIAQGAYGTLDLQQTEMNIIMVNDETIFTHLDEYIETLKSLDSRIKHTALINLRDEMLGDTDQLKYLLKFQ